MKILVTGGAGYIGTELVESLASREEISEIIVLDNLSRNTYDSFLGEKKKGHDKIKFIEGDILDSRKVKKCLNGTHAVYHLAAKVTTPFANTDPHFYEQVNHWGTAEMVYALEESQVKKFIYTSSVGVYGSSKNFIDEKSTPNPKTFYGISKLRGEEHVRRLEKKMDTYILRCGNVYGYSRSMRFDAVINRFVFETNFNHKISIHGSGKQYRPFMHIDVIRRILTDILFSNAPPGTYNVLDKNLQVMDIVEVLKELEPDLEFMFVNQHLDLRQLRVKPETSLGNHVDMSNPRSLKEELAEFLGRFAY